MVKNIFSSLVPPYSLLKIHLLAQVGGFLPTHHMNPMMCTMQPIMAACHEFA